MEKPAQRESLKQFEERIDGMTPAELGAELYRLTSVVAVEPVYGCHYQCPQCVFKGDLPKALSFMAVGKLKKTLQEMRRKSIRPRIFSYALRGNPLSHPKLNRITEAIREANPNAEIVCFWGVGGVDSLEELEKRTRGGLNRLLISLDDHHLSGLVKELRARGEKKNVRRLAIEEVTRRLKWAKAAAGKNHFEIGLRLTGTEEEQNRWLELSKQAGLAVTPENMVQSTRLPPGYEVGKSLHFDRLDAMALAILNDGSLVERMPGLKRVATNCKPKTTN